MKLFDCPNNTWVRVVGDATVPPGAPLLNDGDVVKFHHIDGMYSYCHDKHGNVVHLLAWQEVEVVKTI